MRHEYLPALKQARLGAALSFGTSYRGFVSKKDYHTQTPDIDTESRHTCNSRRVGLGIKSVI
jgi:hypothetical protein